MTAAAPAAPRSRRAIVSPAVDTLAVGGLSLLAFVPLLLSGRTDLVLISAGTQATIAALLPRLREDNLTQALELANLPEQIRGFGHVKLHNLGKTKARWKQLEDELQGRASQLGAAQSSVPPLHAA